MNAIMRNAVVLGVIVVIDQLPWVHGQNCMWDEFNGGTYPSSPCTAATVEFDGVTGVTAHDLATQDPCNCDCSDTCPTCVSLGASAISCSQGENPMPLGTMFGACLGSDDNIMLSINIDVTIKNAVEDLGLYIAKDGGETSDCRRVHVCMCSWLTYPSQLFAFLR